MQWTAHLDKLITAALGVLIILVGVNASRFILNKELAKRARPVLIICGVLLILINLGGIFFSGK